MSFFAGALLAHDFLHDAIRRSAEYGAVDVPAMRARLAELFGAFPFGRTPNEAQTEDDLIWPVLALLGWSDGLRQQNLSAAGRGDVPDGLLFADAVAKAAANAQAEEWRRYGHGLAIVESKRWGRPLDRATTRGEASAPSTQMLRYLRRVDDLSEGGLRYGILTNGQRWRIYWSGARSVSEQFLEVDLFGALGLAEQGELLSGPAERDHALAVFFSLFARAAFLPSGADGRTLHERARAQSSFYEERVARSLSSLVFERVFPDLVRAIADAAPNAPLPEVREAALVLLYRLLFMLYAEDRDLLPVNERRYDDYALRALREEVRRRLDAGDALSNSAAPMWHRIADLARIIDAGDASVGIPPYNGGLFARQRTPLLDAIRLPDAVIAPALDALSFELDGGERRYINYRDLSVQQLGSIYERLLEHEVVRTDDGIAIRPNAFARKNSGSYYTPDELVQLILEQTLEPLFDDADAAFDAALAALRPGDAPDYRGRQLEAADPAKAILALKICDPAMGSGHFLVSLVDTLADRVLEAIAAAAERASAEEYVSPLMADIARVRDTILANAEGGGWNIDPAHLDDRHIVRRMVLKRCVYGVDKNPMAVELAKVALWLHTFTVGAPLSFIDHHLRCGDSLFGLWVRDAIDKSERLGGGLLHADPLRQAQASAAAMGVIESLTDAEIAEAHRSAEMYFGITAQTAPLDAFVSLIHAFDWLRPTRPAERRKFDGSVRQWLDGQFGDPVQIAEGRADPRARGREEDAEAFAAILTRARALIAEERFLNWQIAFPGVWSDWSSAERKGGFDAIVGNPPWDRIKLQQVEWFAARRPEIALAQRASDRARMIRALADAGDPLHADFVHADARAADTLRMARDGGHYPLLSRGDINLYSLFVERAHALVKQGPNERGGMVGLLTPSGIASDLSASAFFRGVATEGRLKALYDFENRRTRYGEQPYFPDVDSRFKFAAMAASPQRTFDAAHCGFFLQSVQEIADPDRAFAISATDFAQVNPNTGTAPIFRSRRDRTLTTTIYARLPVLVDRRGTEPVAAWPVRYRTMFHMTNDSHLFRTRAELADREGAWPVGGNRWQSAAGDWVPLYEGKMVQAFDHRAASILVNADNLNRPAQPLPATDAQHGDPAWLPDPQFWIRPADVLSSSPYVLAFKDVTAPTNMRSMIAAVLPTGTAGNTLPIIDTAADGSQSPETIALLAANLNSSIFDYVARQKIQGLHLNWFIVEQLPVVPPPAYDRAFGDATARDIVRAAVLELTYTAHDMAPFARDLGHVDSEGAVLPPFVWDEERRLKLRAKLDALYFILYGIWNADNSEQSREDIRYIYSTFPIVERDERARYGGRYRSPELALNWINALMAGRPDADVQD